MPDVSDVVRYANLTVSPRPEFFTEVDLRESRGRIDARLPTTFGRVETSAVEWGKVMWACCRGPLEAATTVNRGEVERHVREGCLTFLFEQDGRFKHDSVVLGKSDNA